MSAAGRAGAGGPPDPALGLVLASGNAHKRDELARLLGGAVALETLPAGVALPPETGETFAANARIKAAGAVAALGRRCLADDSGVEAAALGGRPGVRSARYAGPRAADGENLAKLVREVPAGSGLRYVCVLVLRGPDGREWVARGTVEGTMAPAPRGAGGFGYDPVFVPDGHGGRTMAELSREEKDLVSHRGRAARALLERLAATGLV